MDQQPAKKVLKGVLRHGKRILLIGGATIIGAAILVFSKNAAKDEFDELIRLFQAGKYRIK